MTYPWEDLENEECMYRIMIVEDDEVIANAIRQHLVSWGMEAFCVQDFSDVLTEFAAIGPQLVLMDIHLPFFNGYHWCQEIRKVSKAPVLFLSSASDNMSIIMAVNMGGDDFIAKPFDLRYRHCFEEPMNLLEPRICWSTKEQSWIKKTGF